VETKSERDRRNLATIEGRLAAGKILEKSTAPLKPAEEVERERREFSRLYFVEKTKHTPRQQSK